MESFLLKGNRLANEDMADEFYLQLYRQMNRKRSSDKNIKAITIALIMMVVLSKFLQPTRDLIDGLESWLLNLKDDV